ncbi:MAG: type IV secretion system protein [Brevundimonas sp.]|uniref:type IV secretion system protein n=1 Tax=Brevundimonas sp. TaxID=1871086 RepID=UPI002612C4C9|nr:type IV secretion system protein [Brevundimonas sp.]MDI6623266.1 type IV secretion system protein [Brevundimonas sp.]MDQ7812457.1 type IV secretion system protein [Brevundimonas sp.]
MNIGACPALTTGEAFLSTLLRHIDCQAQTIGSTGYQALADPGSPLAAVLTGLLTLFVALFGFRMLFGQAPSVRDMVMAAVKIGVVLTLATSWGAYRTVVYDVIVDGPSHLSAAIGRPAALPGAGGDLIDRLQAADGAIIRLTNLGTGREDGISRPPPGRTDPNQPPERTPLPDNPVLGWARVLFLSGVVAAVATVRVTAGVLLALAPLMAGLLLFDIGRSLFAGWARTLVFTLLASIAVTLMLGVELALLEPWLTQVLLLREARILTASAPVELLILCLAFALALFGSLAVLLRLAFTVHLSINLARLPFLQRGAEPQERLVMLPDQSTPYPAPSRALAVADALRASQTRARTGPTPSYAGSIAQPLTAPRAAGGQADGFMAPSFGQTLRRSRPRKSLGAALRDRRS